MFPRKVPDDALSQINHLNTELNPICHSPALLGTHPILHVSRISVNVRVLITSFLLYEVIWLNRL